MRNRRDCQFRPTLDQVENRISLSSLQAPGHAGSTRPVVVDTATKTRVHYPAHLTANALYVYNLR
jgi:hypothetical protein